MDVGMFEAVRMFTVGLIRIMLMLTKESRAESGKCSGEGTSNEYLPCCSKIDVDVIHKIAFEAAVEAVQYKNRAFPFPPFREPSSSASPMGDVMPPIASYREDEVDVLKLINMVKMLLREVIGYRKVIDDLSARLDELMLA